MLTIIIFVISVIARNPKSLSALSSGKASYGARSILDQADDYLNCAKLYPCMYQSPKVRIVIFSDVVEVVRFASNKSFKFFIS